MAARPRSVQPSLPGLEVSGAEKRAVQHQVGEDGERAVFALHRAAVLAGVATPLRHGDSGLVPVGDKNEDGTIPCRPKREGDLDYHATLRPSGRALHLEVKHASAQPPRWDLRELLEHQAALLEMHHQAGALCLLVVVGPGSNRYAVPWPVVARARLDHATGTGRASLSTEQLTPWLLAAGEMYLGRFLRG